MNNSPSTPVEDRIYVLRHTIAHRRNAFREYYTGRIPTRHIHKAKRFSLSAAKNKKQYAATAHACEIIRVTQKMLFKSALKGE